MIDFTLYPNLNGQLGQNKVQIPDGVTTFWPDGDALVENFVYKDGKLVGMVDTKALINNDTGTTTFPYDFVEITLSDELENTLSIINGERTKYLEVQFKNIDNLPKGYKKLEYIEANGTQFIVTDYGANGELYTVEHVLQFTKTDARQLMGPNASGSYFGCTKDGYYELALRYFSTLCGNKDKVILDLTELKTTKLQVNDEILSRPEPVDRYNYILFAITSESYRCHCRLWSCKFVISDGIVVRNFIPALKVDTNSPCLYDTVTQTPFYNKGTGDFLYTGSESQVVTSSIDDKFYAKMTEHGIQRLYKTPDDYSGTKDDYASEYGFKEIVEPPMPTDGHWSPQWIETDTQLICNWVEVEEMEIL